MNIPVPQWLQNMISFGYHTQKALETYYLATDKDLATKAAYKSLGLDPREAPVFGWNNMMNSQCPPQPVVIQQRSGMLPWLLSFILGLGILGAGVYTLWPKDNSSRSGEREKMHLMGLDLITEELEADPAFAEEIRGDFLKLQGKISEKRKQRVK